jgi:dUTP pyrophosphatase
MKIYPCLYLWVDPAIPGLRDLYNNHVEQHNKEIANSRFPNSGFDLFSATPTDVPADPAKSTLIKLGVRAEMVAYKSSKVISVNDHSEEIVTIPCAYYLMPRSSFSKTPLMQSNSIGLIDAGYRGEIMAPVRNLSKEPYTVAGDTRLFQLVHPNAEPFMVKLVSTVEELSSTERGAGGFGSTGLSGTKAP